jgi:hypothetical protein
MLNRYVIVLALIVSGSAFAQNPPGGGGSGTVNNCATAGVVAYYSASGTAVSCIPNLTVDGSGNLVNTAGLKSGSGGTNSGYTQWNGATSGGQAIGSPAVAGTPILYMLPATAGTAGQVLQDTGATTCPSLASGAPATCHQMVWASATAIGPSANAYNSSTQSLASNTNTAVTFDTNAWDTCPACTIHSTTVNPTRFTAPTTGYYQWGCNVSISQTGGLGMTLSTLINGVAAVPVISAYFPNIFNNSSASISGVLKLTANDYVECFAIADNANGTTYASASAAQLTKLSSTF